MDWRRILGALTSEQRTAIDLAAAWQRYRNTGGADDEAAFTAWLIAQYPVQLPAHPPAIVIAVPVPAPSPIAVDTESQPATRSPSETPPAAITTPESAAPAREPVAETAKPPELSDLDTISLAATPAAAAALDAIAVAPVEVSLVLPARFAKLEAGMSTIFDPHVAAADDNSRTRADEGYATLVDSEDSTVVSARRDERDAQAPAPPAPVPGEQQPGHFRYVLTAIAGQGGMGTVHVAKDTELLRFVALKQLHAGANAIASARTRFLREAQITAQLDHPNIVPVHALEVAPDGMPAYTMKLVNGKNFHALLDEARQAFEDGQKPNENLALAARIEHFLKACDAVAYAHDKGVIHRDLKPANLMLGRHNEVYVMDWGLCRALSQPDEAPADRSAVMTSADISGGASDTQVGDIVGTPKYMSPEQAQGRNRELDTRSDQCALGLILFELVTLSAPYNGSNAYEVLVNAAAGKRRPLVHAYLGKRGVAPDLAAIIDRATAHSRDNRYMSVSEFAADLRRYLRGDAVRARPDSLWQRTQRAIGRHRQSVLTGILGLIALAAVAIGGLLWQNQRVFASERLREQRLLQLRDAIAEVSSDVQVRMVQLESVVENLSDSVAQITDFGQPVDTRFYLNRDFHDPAMAPGDLVASKTYGGRISISQPVWTLPKGMTDDQAALTIRKLASLQAFHREIYHRSAVMIRNRLIDVYAQTTSGDGDDADGNPLVAIAIGLSNGISSRYPGWDGLPDDYDPRQQPWYTVAEGTKSPQWSDPYLSATTHRTQLSVSVPMYQSDQRFLGVASALLNPDLMVRSLLEIKGIAGVRDVVLIDGNGHILASLNHTLPPSEGKGDAAIEVFPVPELLKRQKLHETGILETRLRGQPVVLAFDEVEPFDWNIVAIADPDALLTTKP